MLDRLISERAGAGSAAFGVRVGRIVQRVSRAVALPALALMLGGLLLFALEHQATSLEPDWLLQHPVLPLRALASRALFSPTGLMSAGLLALALVPMVTVLLIFVQAVKIQRWQEAAVALLVSGILVLSLLLGY